MMQVFKIFNCPSCDLHFTGKDGYRTYTNSRYPLLLKCGHTVCESCISSSVKVQHSFTCPNCQEVTEFEPGATPISKLLADIYVLGVVNAKHALPSLENKLVPAVPLKKENRDIPFVSCDHCSVKEATFRCKKCEENFCNVCFDTYHNSKRRKKHVAMRIYADTYQSLVQEGCTEHDNRAIEFYCEDDNTLTCSHCVITGSHKGHAIVTLAEKNESCAENLKTVYDDVLIFSKRLKFTEQKLSQAIPSEKVDCSHVVKQIRTHFHSLHSALLLRETELLQQMEDISNINVGQISKLRQEVSDSSKDVEALLRDAACAIENPNISLSIPTVINKLEFVKTMPCHLLPVSDPEPSKDIFVTFKEHLREKILEHGKITAEIKPKYCLRANNDLPCDFIVEPLPPELQPIPTDTESLISDTMSEDSLCLAPVKNERDNLGVPKKIFSSSGPTAKLEKVVVCHIDDPTCFFIRKSSDHTKQLMIENCITRVIQSKMKPIGSNPDSYKKGDVHLVCFTNDNEWYRGRIVDIITPNLITPDILLNGDGLSENGDGLDEDKLKIKKDPPLMAEVYYIDFGNSEIVPISRIRPIEKELLKYPGLAKKCSLHNIVPQNNKWTLEAKRVFQDFVYQKEVNMHLIEEISGVLYVDLIQIAATEAVMDVPISVRDAIIFLEHGTFLDETEILKVKKIRKFRSFLPPERIGVSSRVNVNITCMESPSSFYVQQVSTSRQLSELIVDMQKVYSADTNILHTIYVPYIGMICAAQFQNDKTWYRAEVLGLPGGAQVEIEFVDFGYRQTLNHCYLRKIQDCFTKLTKQAVLCTLADVSFPEGTGWSEKSINWLSEYTRQKRFILLSLGCEQNSSKTRAVLYDFASHVETCINTLMVDKGMAVSTGLYSTVLRKNRDKPKVVPKIEKKPAVPQGNQHTLYENGPSTSQHQSLFDNEPEPESTVRPKSPKLKGELADSVKVLMGHIESPGSFYVRMAEMEDNFKKMMSEMQEAYAELESSDVECKIGGTYAAYREYDKTWHRVIVLSVVESDSVQVRFPDHGNCEKIAIKNLRPLIPKFEDIKAYSIRCFLSDVVPAGDSNKKWSKVAMDLFCDIVTPHEALYLVNGDVDSMVPNSLPSDLFYEEFIRGGALEASTYVHKSVTKSLVEKGVAIPIRKRKPVTNNVEASNSVAAGPSNSVINNQEVIHDQTPEVASMPLSPPLPSFQWKAPKMPESMEFTAIPTHVSDDGCIFMQTSPDGVSTASLIKTALDIKYQNGKFKPVRIAPPVGEACIAEFELDKKFYRAEIIESSPKKLKVQFVDYGNYEGLTLKKIQVDAPMKDLPRQCIECELADLEPPNGKWPVKILDFIHERIVEQICQIKVVHPMEPGKKLQISLDFPMGNLNSLIADILDVPERAENSDDSLSDFSDDDMVGFQEATPLRIGGEPFPVCISSVLEPNVMYLQCLSTPALETRNEELQKFLELMSHLASNAENFPPIGNPVRGRVCVAPYAHDDGWYRSIITGTEDDGVRVRYVDYGNSGVVPLVRLREPDEYALDFPMQAHLCKIKGIEPAFDTWTQAVSDALSQRCFHPETNLFARVVTKSDIYEVDLLIEVSDGEFRLAYQDLIDEGVLKGHKN